MNKILQRFCSIWKLDFLANFFAQDHHDNKTTVWFWIISNTLVALVVSVYFCISLSSFSSVLIEGINVNVPDGARASIVDGQLITENIDEPIFHEINAENTYNGEYRESYAIIVDTRTEAYDITSLDAYDGGIIALADRAYFKDGSEINHVVFADVPNFSLTKEEVISFIELYFFFPFLVVLTGVIFVVLIFFYNVLRLVMAFWWALMLFVLTKIFGIDVKYMVAYKAILNLYFIPSVVMLLIMFIGIHVPLLTTSIFIVVFIANLLWIKKHTVKNAAEERTLDAESNKKEADVRVAETRDNIDIM